MRNVEQSVKLMMIAVVVGLMPGLGDQAAAKPLKVFILAGQSNMQGHVNVSTFDSLADDPKTAPLLKEMRNADGKPHVCRKVWISSIGCAGDDTAEQKGKLTAGFGASPSEIGPEFTFGIYMEKQLNEPILIIKTSWGGKNLLGDFRPPSAGKRVFNDTFVKGWKGMGVDPVREAARHNSELNGVYYRHMIEHVRKVLADIKRVVPDYDPKKGYELAGFVWFQGWNDLVDGWSYPNQNQPGGYDEYSQMLTLFIRDVRKDLSAPKMPFVIGVMGIGGVKEDKRPGSQMYFRQSMAAPASLPEFKGNVIAVQTAPFWSEELAAIEEKKGKVDQMRWLLGVKDKNTPNADGKMTAARIDEYMKNYEAKLISPAEVALWQRGASNGGYHYLGAAKIMAPIGKAFAEAMVKLQTTQRDEKQ